MDDKDLHGLALVPVNALLDEVMSRFTDYIFMGFVDKGSRRADATYERFGGCTFRALGMANTMTRVIEEYLDVERAETEIDGEDTE